MADETVETTHSGASTTYPQQCSGLRKNGHVMIKGHPCKIVEMSTSKTGKHGHAKINLVGIDIFTGKKYEDICPSTHNMDVPHVQRKDYQLLEIQEDSYLELMDDDGTTRQDIKYTEGQSGLENLQEKYDAGSTLIITILKACGQESPIAYKETIDKD